MSSSSYSKTILTAALSRLKASAISGSFTTAAQHAFELKDDDPEVERLSNAFAEDDWHVLPPIELLDGQTMAGLRGAYTASDPNGQERIYLMPPGCKGPTPRRSKPFSWRKSAMPSTITSIRAKTVLGMKEQPLQRLCTIAAFQNQPIRSRTNGF